MCKPGMNETAMNQIQTIQQTLERLSSLLRAEEWKIGAEYNLQPIQLQMLRYLHICNRYSNTPIAVTDYFALTKGTASQSLKLLEAKGLISKQPDAKDGRLVHLAVTPRGVEVLAAIQQQSLLPRVCETMESAEQQAIGTALVDLLRLMQRAEPIKSYGVCATCRYHQVEAEGKFRCGLTGEPLLPEETTRICREHCESINDESRKTA